MAEHVIHRASVDGKVIATTHTSEKTFYGVSQKGQRHGRQLLNVTEFVHGVIGSREYVDRPVRITVEILGDADWSSAFGSPDVPD